MIEPFRIIDDYDDIDHRDNLENGCASKKMFLFEETD
jgi:hypothetical protein